MIDMLECIPRAVQNDLEDSRRITSNIDTEHLRIAEVRALIEQHQGEALHGQHLYHGKPINTQKQRQDVLRELLAAEAHSESKRMHEEKEIVVATLERGNVVPRMFAPGLAEELVLLNNICSKYSSQDGLVRASTVVFDDRNLQATLSQISNGKRSGSRVVKEFDNPNFKSFETED